MADDANLTTESVAADATAATPPSQEQSSAAATTGTTAPPVNAAREAFDKLARGERPEDVNKGYRASVKAASSVPSQRATPANEQAKPEAKPQPSQQGNDNPWPEGTDAKDVQVLKRAQMEAEVWRAIPPSNRAKILAGLKTSQAAADRQFQAAKAAAKGKGGADAAAATTQTTTDTQDSATQGAEDTVTGDEAQEPVAGQQQQQASRQPANPQQQQPKFLAAKDREALELLGGDDLAETMERSLQSVHQQALQQAQQQTAPMLGVLEFLLNQHVEGQFNSTVAELAKQPGMETLTSGDKATVNQQALKQKAMLLHRAAGDPNGYPFSEAIKDAAASLFKTNLQQATQARLLQQRNSSLRGAPDKGDGTRNTPRALDAKERNRQIFSNLSQGMEPNAARMAVDGA